MDVTLCEGERGDKLGSERWGTSPINRSIQFLADDEFAVSAIDEWVDNGRQSVEKRQRCRCEEALNMMRK